MFARLTRRSLTRFYSNGVSNKTSASGSNAAPPPEKVNVPGLSSAVINPASEPVGPGVEPNKTGAYKAPEYYCYNETSFYEAEIEMASYRCPQPSALKK